jgi:hypothetical protein
MEVAYAQAIEILMNGKPDYCAIAIRLAQVDPSLFVRLHNKNTPITIPTWMQDAVTQIRSGNHMQAIRTTRAGADLGLRGAKAICDNVAFGLYAPSVEVQRIFADLILTYGRSLAQG